MIVVSVEPQFVRVVGNGANFDVERDGIVEILFPSGKIVIPEPEKIPTPTEVFGAETNQEPIENPFEKYVPIEYEGQLTAKIFRGAYQRVAEDGGTMNELMKLFPRVNERNLQNHMYRLKLTLGKRFRPLKSRR